MVGRYITAAYWFTASTSFANPAVTIARSLSNTFAGIAPASVPLFIIAQLGLLDPRVSSDQILDAMVAHPVLVNRPIVVTPRPRRASRRSIA